MKKALIVTLYANTNYGNKLQNYALQEILKKYNLDVETLINYQQLNNENLTSYLKFVKKYIVNKLKYSNNILLGYDKNDNKGKQNNFKKFDSKINRTKYVYTKYHNNSIRKYDYYIVGSDQIWNPNYGGTNKINLLNINLKNKIKLSYAASFGIDELTEEQQQIYQKALKSFNGISVRESSGSDIIKKLLGKNAPVLVDPTMLLTEEEWKTHMIKPKNMTKKQYILCYFLGNKNTQFIDEIKKYANDNNYELIDISDRESKYNNCGPSEFLYLERNAKFIFTDSFHSAVFAILFKTPFLVADREGKHNNMNSRISTLLNKFNLMSQYYTGGIIKKYEKVDFNKTDDILDKERQKSKQYLDKYIMKESD